MEAREEKQKLKALNLIGRVVQLQVGGTRMNGSVFFFNQKVLILQREREYILINLSKHEDLMIQVSKIPSSTGANGELNVEAIRPNDLLAAILD